MLLDRKIASLCKRLDEESIRVTAGRGVEKVEPGSEKILGVGLNFKIGICPAHPRSDVGLEKLRALCEVYVKRDHTSDHQSLVCAYA